MLSLQDIKVRNVIVVNALEQRKFNIALGNIVITNEETGEILTKLSCYKVLAIFVVGHLTITSQVLENLNKFGISLVLLKPNFRPFFNIGSSAEANYLLRERQYKNQNNLDVAKAILKNKVFNQIGALSQIRDNGLELRKTIEQCEELAGRYDQADGLQLPQLMGIEGKIAKLYFDVMFNYEGWSGRRPRAKLDPYNVVLDIGYTLLFNFIECFLKLFGFDLYFGVCHTTWFKRKSLVCDIVEPFRVVIDWQIRKSWNLKQFSYKHFEFKNGQYILLRDYSKVYYQVFFEELIDHKEIIFEYIRGYYRSFMGQKSILDYPVFNYSTRRVEYANCKL